MKLLRLSVVIFSLIAAPSMAQVNDHAPMSPAAPSPALMTPIKIADGSTIGTLSLTGASTGVLLQVDISKGLTPGWHGMHLHQTGDCSDPKFMTSGGHMNHAENKSPHGFLSAGGPDFGDLINLYGSSSPEQVLRDADGAALIIHANPDDQISQPIGGAGGRVACAVIK
jgi:superoxide dismutase, Cu-Zn family